MVRMHSDRALLHRATNKVRSIATDSDCLECWGKPGKAQWGLTGLDEFISV